MAKQFYDSVEVKMCKDGKYRWVYELEMLKNTALLKEIYRAFFITCLLVGVIAFFIGIGDGFVDALILAASALGITLVVFFTLGFVAYLILAWMNSGKYSVVFEMDEKGVMHAQQQKGVKKAELIGAIAAIAGAASGRIGTVGTGILVATKTKMYSGFDGVKVIEAVPGSNLIRLNGTLDRNQVYASNDDFGFVLNYIIQHCPKAELKGDYQAYLHMNRNYVEPEAEAQDEIKFCSNCGARLEGGSFCVKCGSKIK